MRTMTKKEKPRGRKELSARGSVTIYFAMCFALMISLIFTLLEGARIRGLKIEADRLAHAAIRSVFAEYDRKLLERYDLIMLDGGYLKGGFDISQAESRWGKFIYENTKEGGGLLSTKNFFPIHLMDDEISEYELSTDADGAPYFNMATDYMKSKMGVNAARTLLNKLNAQNVDDDSGNLEDTWESALDANEALDTDEAYGEEENASITEEEKQKAEEVSEEDKGLMDNVSELMAEGVLALCMEDLSTVSGKGISSADLLSQRTLNAGNRPDTERETGAYRKVFFLSYIGEKFSMYGDRKGGKSALDYEMEYIYAGKDTDKENLSAVAEALLGIREAANFAYLMTDAGKQSEARILAIAIAGLLALPAIVEAIYYGILVAWSFMESVADVRCLFSGGKVPLVKTAADWKTSLSVNAQAEEAGGGRGLDYGEYLQALLFLKSEKDLTLRSMDLIEKNIALEDGYGMFRMDRCITYAKWSADFTAGPMFMSLVGNSPGKDGYRYRSEGIYYYE